MGCHTNPHTRSSTVQHVISNVCRRPSCRRVCTAHAMAQRVWTNQDRIDEATMRIEVRRNAMADVEKEGWRAWTTTAKDATMCWPRRTSTWLEMARQARWKDVVLTRDGRRTKRTMRETRTHDADDASTCQKKNRIRRVSRDPDTSSSHRNVLSKDLSKRNRRRSRNTSIRKRMEMEPCPLHMDTPRRTCRHKPGR